MKFRLSILSGLVLFLNIPLLYPQTFSEKKPVALVRCRSIIQVKHKNLVTDFIAKTQTNQSYGNWLKRQAAASMATT
jgi:hypothetical protein